MIPRRKQKNSFNDLISFLKGNHKKQDVNVIDCFKKKLGEVTQLDYRKIILTSSGREAILLGLKSLGLKKGDEIIISALNLGELVPLLQSNGYVIRLVDINKNDLSININSFKAQLNDKSKILILTHLFSIVETNQEIINIAKDKNILIFEDCAHTLDHIAARFKDSSLMSDGIIFSFEMNKPITTYGGGALYLNNQGHVDQAQSKIESLNLNPKAMLRKICFSLLEETIIFSPLFKPLIAFLSSPKVQAIFEKTYRSTNDKVRIPSLFLSFQANKGLNELDKYPLRNALIKTTLNEIYKINNPDINFLDGMLEAKSFYSFVFLTKNPQHLKKEAFKHNIDVGIGSEVIDDCSKYFNDIQMLHSREIEKSIVLYPLYFNLSIEEKMRLIMFLKNYRYQES